MNKPRISYRHTHYFDNLPKFPYWICEGENSNGYGIGIGDTPEESYNNYIKQSWLRRFINWFKS